MASKLIQRRLKAGCLSDAVLKTVKLAHHHRPRLNWFAIPSGTKSRSTACDCFVMEDDLQVGADRDLGGAPCDAVGQTSMTTNEQKITFGEMRARVRAAQEDDAVDVV